MIAKLFFFTYFINISFQKIYQEIFWTAGTVACSKLNKLSLNYYKESLKIYNKKFKLNFQNYEPWINLGLYQNNPINYELNNSQKLLVQKYQLEKLHPYFCSSLNEIDFLDDIAEKKIFFDFSCSSRALSIQQTFNSISKTLDKSICWYSKLESILVKRIIPVTIKGTPNNFVAFSSHVTKGLIFINCPNFESLKNAETSKFQMAIDFFHEIGHQVLMIYLLSDKIITSDPSTLVFSGARKALRPSFRALHSAFALLYMSIAARSIYENSSSKVRDYLKTEASSYSSALRKNIDDLKEKCSFTKFGKIIIDEIDYMCDIMSYEQ